MNIIDSHHHLWIPEQQHHGIGYRWLKDIGSPKPFGDPTPIQRDYEWPEFRAELSTGTLCGSVYVQVDGSIGDPVAEVAWVQSVFNATGLSHGIVGLVDLSSPQAENTLEAQNAHADFRGVRQIIARLDDQPRLSFASEHFLRNSLWRENFGLLADRGLSFDLQLYPEQMQEAAEFLVQHGGVRVVVDHAGSPHDQSPSGLARWRSGMQMLAELPQVSVKLSGFGMYDRQRSSSSMQPLVDTLFELFGTERLMFGSNFPVDSLMGSYDELLRVVQDTLPGDALQMKKIFHDNAVDFYRL